MKILKWRIIPESEYAALIAERKELYGQIMRLSAIEAKYLALTDRDEKGRFVK